MHYIIDPNTFEVSLFSSESDPVPVMRQPYWPNGTPFASKTQAEDFVLAVIEASVNPDAPLAPAGPGLPGEPRVSIELTALSGTQEPAIADAP